jgi:hypothetical protein
VSCVSDNAASTRRSWVRGVRERLELWRTVAGFEVGDLREVRGESLTASRIWVHAFERRGLPSWLALLAPAGVLWIVGVLGGIP